MFGPGLVLAALATLAQAEAAPPEATPPPPPPASAPAAASAPAPAPPEPTGADSDGPPNFALTIGFAGARRLGDGPRTLGPRYGFEVSTAVEGIYARIGGVDLAAGIRFDYQRFRKQVSLAFPGTSGSTLEGDRTFSYYEFELRQIVAIPMAFFRPYLSAGIGLSIGHFTTEELALSPGEARANRLGIGATAGFDVPIGRRTDARIGLFLGATMLVRPPHLQTSAGQDITVFDSRSSAGIALWQPF